MDDKAIVELFWSRDPRAIEVSQEKYAQSCQSLAERLLGSVEDGQECVNDALHRAWETIPPQRPDSLRAYLRKIVRNLAIDRWRSQTSQRRGGGLSALALELEDCLPAAPSAEAAAEGQEITACMDRWLDGLPREDRLLFVRRYWYGDALDELAGRFGGSPNRLAQKLYRLRGGLRRALEKEGIIV